jgi:hypothetical protein
MLRSQRWNEGTPGRAQGQRRPTGAHLRPEARTVVPRPIDPPVRRPVCATASMHLSRAMTAGGRSAVAIASACEERRRLAPPRCSSCLEGAARLRPNRRAAADQPMFGPPPGGCGELCCAQRRRGGLSRSCRTPDYVCQDIAPPRRPPGVLAQPTAECARRAVLLTTCGSFDAAPCHRRVNGERCVHRAGASTASGASEGRAPRLRSDRRHGGERQPAGRLCRTSRSWAG